MRNVLRGKTNHNAKQKSPERSARVQGWREALTGQERYPGKEAHSDGFADCGVL